MRVFAKIGDLVTCENGHPICTVAKDLHTTGVVTASSFKDWQIKIDTSHGKRVAPCPICGAEFMEHRAGTFPSGLKIFIDGAWRP